MKVESASEQCARGAGVVPVCAEEREPGDSAPDAALPRLPELRRCSTGSTYAVLGLTQYQR